MSGDPADAPRPGPPLDGPGGPRRDPADGRVPVPDAHCHLDQLDDPDRAIEEALAAGVDPILAVSMDSASADGLLELRRRHADHLLVGIGLHPSRVAGIATAEQQVELRRLEALVPDADFIGEIGLDHKDAVTAADRARQLEAFHLQLGWAAARRVPVNLHSRRADRQVLDEAFAFRERTGLGALMHWFTRSEKLARLCAAAGVFISPGPSILVDPRSAAVARGIADSILLIETDAPVAYGTEGPARPAWARRVLGRLAELRDRSPEELAHTVRTNLAVYLGGRRP